MRYTITLDPSIDGELEQIVVDDDHLVAGDLTWLAHIVRGAVDSGALAVPAGPGGADIVAWDRPDLIVSWLLDRVDDGVQVTLTHDRRSGVAQPADAVV